MLVKWVAWTGRWSRGIAAGVATLLALAVLPAFAAGSSPAKAFLDSIYQHYVGSSAAAAKGIPLANAKAVRGYFTVGLASLIIEDRAAAAKRNEPPVLDGDPFVGRQDWDISNLAIDVKDSGGFKAVGTVTFMDGGKPSKVVLELLRSGNDWRIADIEWESGTLRGLYRRKAARDNAAAAPR
jgi:uncharacterized protein DUF3828